MTLESAAATAMVEVFLSLGPNKRTSLSLTLSLFHSLYFSLTSWLEASRRELFIFLSLGEEGRKKMLQIFMSLRDSSHIQDVGSGTLW